MKRKLIFLIVTLGIYIPIVHATYIFPDGDKSANKNKAETEAASVKRWEFYSAIQKPSEEALANESNYRFGQEAGYLYTLFMNIYVAREEVVPGDPTCRTVIRKPIIYNAVRSIEKQLSKDLKSSSSPNNKEITDNFVHVLRVAISAFDSDSASFENALQENRKDATSLLSLFKCAKLTDI
jgi:hypothetical protein